jgi:3-(3-hydroxy-phenyl)propionate hydroxylase
MDHEIMRVLQQIGVLEQLAGHADSVDDYLFQNAAGEILLEVRGGGRLAGSGHPASTMFVQPELEAILRARIASMAGVDARFGALVTRFQADDGVTVTFEHNGTTQHAHGRYLVGCDGASSFVRRALATQMEDLGFDEPWVVVDTRMKRDIGLPSHIAYQFCDPRRPTTCVPAGPGRRRWEFMLLPGESRETMGAWDAVWPLLEPWGGRDALEPVRLAVYRFHALTARRWRVGPVLLAGDAAHQTPPFMGQGLCSGVRDAASLAWRLDRILAGAASDALLDSYQEERAPHFRHVVETSVAMGRIVCELDPAKAAQRDAFMKAARESGATNLGAPRGGQVAPLVSGIIHADDAGAGWLFPQPSGRWRGRDGRMDDLVGCGVRVVCDDAGLLPDAATLARIGATAVVLGPDGFVEAGGPSARAWLDEHHVHAALVRPDHYVFGTAPNRAGVQRLIDEFSRALR